MYDNDSYMLDCNVTDQVATEVAIDDIENQPLCYWCGSSELAYLGHLGNTGYFRCVCCGQNNTAEAGDVEEGL